MMISNAVVGVSEGSKKTVRFVGVGYRATLEGTTLSCRLGNAHPDVFTLPEGIKAQLEGPTLFI